jgi:hypothetical protein
MMATRLALLVGLLMWGAGCGDDDHDDDHAADGDSDSDSDSDADAGECSDDAGSCDCIARCYVDTNCAGPKEVCVCDVAPCFCHQCIALPNG